MAEHKQKQPREISGIMSISERLRREKIASILIIYIPVADDQDKDGEDIILDLVDDAVVADADTVAGPAFEFPVAINARAKEDTPAYASP